MCQVCWERVTSALHPLPPPLAAEQTTFVGSFLSSSACKMGFVFIEAVTSVPLVLLPQ